MIPIHLRLNLLISNPYKMFRTTLINSKCPITQKLMRLRCNKIPIIQTTSNSKTCKLNNIHNNRWIINIVNKTSDCQWTYHNRMRLTRFRRINNFFKIRCKLSVTYSHINKCLITNPDSKPQTNLIEWQTL